MASTGAPLKIVRLDGIHLPRPQFSIPHSYIEYVSTSIEAVSHRIADAEIIITTNVPLIAANLDVSVSPSLKLVAVMATGTDLIDLKACHTRGILVCNVPAGSNESVAQHAFAMFLALRRRLGSLHQVVLENEAWPSKKTCVSEFRVVPRGWSEEVVGIVGAGNLGTHYH